MARLAFKLFPTISLVIVFLSGCASIPRQPWTDADKVMFAAACAANVYDYKTTKDALDGGHRMCSGWQWMYGGDTPASSTLAFSKAAQLGLAWAVLDRVKSKYRKAVLAIMTGTWVWYGTRNK